MKSLLSTFSGKIILLAFSVSVISAATTTLLYVKANSNSQIPIKNSQILQKVQAHTQLVPDKTQFNILLMGYGGANHSGGGLADAILLANINTVTKVVNLISIPRDTWVELPLRSDLRQGHKINAAFAIGNDDKSYPLKEPAYKGQHGGGQMAMYAIELITGIKPDYYAAIDFSSFENSIDALGGINVDVPVTFDDFFYPVKGLENESCGLSAEKITEVHQLYSGFELEKQFTCRYEHLHFDAGSTQMDGQTALKFVRSRHSDQHGGDFARGQRQQAVLTAVRDKLISLDALNRIDDFVLQFKDLVRTDIEETDIIEMLSHTGNPLDYEPKNININTDNFLINSTSADGQYILIPKGGVNNWDSIHEYLRREIELTE